MKNIVKYYIIAVLTLGMVSCQQFKNLDGVGKLTIFSVGIQVNAIVEEGMPSPQSYTVKFNNYSEGYETTKETDATGFVKTDDIIPGIYSVTVSAEISHNGFSYNFNGNLVNVSILKNEEQFTVDVTASRSGNIVLKEIYYCGSKTVSGGTYFRDQFYEIYNNSNSVQYLDGLCIGSMLPLTATANLPVWPDEYKDDHVFFGTIWQVPGSGQEYPLQPGESAIIAQMADNHQREALNPACPVNLITAEFETYVNSTVLIKDNPAVNMEIAFWPRPTPQWLVTVFGGAYAIFYPEEEINPNTYVSPIGQTTMAKQVKISQIVDAVELVNDQTKMQLKRVPALLDAGATTVEATYCGKSVSRKIRETLEDGRIIYMDTNNSSEDFQVNDTPVIRRNGAKIPAWNVWAN